MSYIQKQGGRYRARFKDPFGNTLSRTFTSKADAQRFLLDLEADRVRGRWVDPRDADMPVAVWAEEWLSWQCPVAWWGFEVDPRCQSPLLSSATVSVSRSG